MAYTGAEQIEPPRGPFPLPCAHLRRRRDTDWKTLREELDL